MQQPLAYKSQVRGRAKTRKLLMQDEYHLDYETYSACNISNGAHRYAMDESTEVFMFSICKNDGPVHLWIAPGYETLENCSEWEAEELLIEAISSPDSLIYAHNAQFERVISDHVLRRLHRQFKKIPIDKWRCTAVMARRAGLPSSLAKVSKELDLEDQKDSKGKALIRFFCLPQKDGSRNYPQDNPEKWADFCNYCVQDTHTERAVHKRLKPFEIKGASLRAFQLDIKINDRGIPVNVPALKNADAMIVRVLEKAVHRFRELTGFNPTQNAKCLAWFKERGYPLDNMQADSIRDFVENGNELDDDEAQEALIMKSELGFAAIKKVSSMLRCVCPDGRVRGTLIFCGASNTGRWSGALIQPQNFKRPTFKRTDIAFALIEHGATEDEIEMLFGNVLNVIASCIRHFIKGPFLDSDYTAVEGRIVCWLADDQVALKEFVDFDHGIGEEPYCLMAERIYHRKVTKADFIERFIGKQAVLGCGFGMGWKKYQSTCESYGQAIEAKLAKDAVAAFRKARKPVADLWKECDKASQNAIRNPGKTFYAGKYLRFTMLTVSGIPMLLMKLPSGRNLTYLKPKLKNAVVTLDEIDPKTGKQKKFNTQQIEFYGPIPSRKDVFGTITTYGGKLVENATQATAYDLMAYGGCKAEEAFYEICMLVHDQALTEKTPEKNISKFNQLLATLPAWAKGMPLKAEGNEIPYYRKD